METEFWRKYRPKTLDEVPMEAGAREHLQRLQERGAPPDLLLVGPEHAELGRMARVFAQGYDAHILVVPSLDQRSVERVRRQLRLTSGGLAGAKWRIVVLENVDRVPASALEDVGRLLQSSTRSDCGRLVATCDASSDLPPAFRLALTQIPVPEPPSDEVERVLKG